MEETRHLDDWIAPEQPLSEICDCFRCAETVFVQDCWFDKEWNGFICSTCEEFGGSHSHGGLWRRECDSCGEWVHPSELVELLTGDHFCMEHVEAKIKRRADRALEHVRHAIGVLSSLDRQSAEVAASVCRDKRMTHVKSGSSGFDARFWSLLHDICSHQSAVVEREVFDSYTGDKNFSGPWGGIQS